MLKFNQVVHSPEVDGITFAVATYFMHLKICKKGHIWLLPSLWLGLITFLELMELSHGKLLDLS